MHITRHLESGARGGTKDDSAIAMIQCGSIFRKLRLAHAFLESKTRVKKEEWETK